MTVEFLKGSTSPIALFTGKHHLDRRALAIIDKLNKGTDDELISTTALAVELDVSPEWLEIGRGPKKNWGPPFIRLSPRRIRYRRGDVKRWLAERAHRSTAEYDTASCAGSCGRKVGSKVVDGKVVPPLGSVTNPEDGGPDAA